MKKNKELFRQYQSYLSKYGVKRIIKYHFCTACYIFMTQTEGDNMYVVFCFEPGNFVPTVTQSYWLDSPIDSLNSMLRKSMNKFYKEIPKALENYQNVL